MSALPARGPAAGRAVPGSIAAAQWAQIRAAAPQVVVTIQRYLQRLAAFLAPGSVDAAENALRQFARWMITDAGLEVIAPVRRDDIENYKVWLAAQPPGRRPGHHGRDAPAADPHRPGVLRVGSSSGTGPTRRPATRSSPGTSRKSPSRCPSSPATATPPG